MIGSFLTRGLVMVFGYAYPAYECYKTVEQNKPEIEQLRFWCQYWILVAVLTVCERIGDAFVSWVPMYSEAKLAFFIYLWYPKTKGTTYVYDSFFRPYVAKHESEIDRSLLELKTRAGDMAFIYWQRAASYGQNRVFEILQYVASQSTPRPRPPPPQPRPESKKPPSPTSSTSSIQHQKESAEEPRPESKKPPSPTSSTSSSQHQKESAEEQQQNPRPTQPRPESEEPPSPTSSTSSSQHQKETAEAPTPAKTTNPQKSISATSVSRKANSAASVSQKANSANSASQKANSAASSAQKANASEITSQARPTEAEGMQIDQISYPANENSNPPPPPPTETVMEEYRVTRAISKRNRSAPNN